MPLLKRDKPILIIENKNIKRIYKKIKFLKYNKFYVNNNTLKKHKSQNNVNIIFK